MKKERVTKEHAATLAEFDQGLRVEFPVPQEVMGLVIGTKGHNVKVAKEVSGVDALDDTDADDRFLSA